MVTRSAAADDDGRLFLVVNASRKEVDFAHISSRLPAGVTLMPAPERALLALQGPARRGGDGAALAGGAGLALHDGGGRACRRLRLPRHPLRLHRRGRLRDLGRGRARGGAGAAAAGAGRREADRPRRARFAAPRGGALPLRPRHRRDHQPRSRRASPGRSRSGGAARAASPAPSASSDELADGPHAQARRHQAGRPRARARGHRDPVAVRRARSATSPRAASAPASTARSPWATSQARLRQARHAGAI